MIKRSLLVGWCCLAFAACDRDAAPVAGDLILDTGLVCACADRSASPVCQGELLLATVGQCQTVAGTTAAAAAVPAADAASDAATDEPPVCPPEADPCFEQCCYAGPKPEPESTDYVITREDRAAAQAAGKNVLEHLYGAAAANVSRFNRLDPRFAYAGKKIRVPIIPEGEVYTPLPWGYGPATGKAKFILVDLKRQFVGLYECGYLKASFPISSGRSSRGPNGENYKTPTGNTKVRAKHIDAVSSKYPEPDGGAPMPYAVGFRGNGYFMHGGDLVGYPASHGCVRLLLEDAKQVYAWAKIGIPVSVVSSFD